MERADAILAHLEKHLGSVVERWVFHSEKGKPAIQVLEFSGGIPGVRNFCTFGFTNYSLEVSHPLEVFVPLEQADEDVPRLIAYSLFVLAKNRVHVGRGTVVAGLDSVAAGFAEKWRKSAFYLTLPFGHPPGFECIPWCGVDIHILLGCFLTTSEYQFLAANGGQQFETHLEASQTDLYVLGRSSILG
jgi:hypothetical protein